MPRCADAALCPLASCVRRVGRHPPQRNVVLLEVVRRDGRAARARVSPAVGESAGALPPLRLGALLRYQGAITQAQLDAGLAAQQRSGLRLGAELQRLGFVSSATLVRALAAQAGVSFLTAVDLTRVGRAPGGLSADMVRALGLLPFEAQDRRLQVICTAPVPRPALRAMARLTGWTAEPFLVDDEVWERALEHYAPALDERHQAEVVHDVAAASAHVVAAAAAGRDAVVRYAGCGDFVWARVEDDTRTQDVLIQEERMPGGAYSALSGMKARLEDLDRLASDIANVGTSGYKTERAATVAAERPSFRAALDSAVDVDDRRHAARLPSGHDQHHRPRSRRGHRGDRLLRRQHAGGRALHAQRGVRAARRRRAHHGRRPAALPAGPLTNPPGQIRVGTGTISIAEDGTVKAGDVEAGKIKVVAFASESDVEREIRHALPRQGRRDARGGGAAHRRRRAGAVERHDGGPHGGAHRGAAHLRSAAARRVGADERDRRAGHWRAWDDGRRGR